MRTEVTLDACVGKTYEGAAWSIEDDYLILLFAGGVFTTLKAVNMRGCPPVVEEGTFDLDDFSEQALTLCGWADALEVKLLKAEAAAARAERNRVWQTQNDLNEYARLKKKFEGT